MRENAPNLPGIAGWYAAPISQFLDASTTDLLGVLLAASPFEVTPAQKEAWSGEFQILRGALRGVDGWLALEFDIPRLGSRVDAVVVSGPAIIPIEFKLGEKVYRRDDINQAWDYALDLKNFHAASHSQPIFPILVASEAPDSDEGWASPHADGVRPPSCCSANGLGEALASALVLATGNEVACPAWFRAAYKPTPTIVAAAQSLYARHTVEAISRNDAGAKNLSVTSGTVQQIIAAAAREQFKAIVFVTGVPGAGKTLVGLNIATSRDRDEAARDAVFLSGNGPLVAVLREALTRDEFARRTANGKRVRKGEVGQEVKQFIHNVHNFRDDGVRTLGENTAPHEHVVIFDEAQRAWNLQKTADFMKRRKGRPGFDRSEPQFLIEYMDRHQDWAVVVCLVGGGQEIHTGEAGISTWLDAVREHFPAWRAFISPELSDHEYAAGHALELLRDHRRVEKRPELHLAVSMRSFRSERLSAFVKALLDINREEARMLLGVVTEHYPLVLSRNLEAARTWLRRNARGSERFGLVASSGAQRLKPHAIDVRVKVDPVQWFLNGPDDTRSSYYLEDVATEYQIQGLELDWICVSWDGDLRFNRGSWQHRSFNAKGWQRVNAQERQQYLVNAYRVLLTRARQGLVIFVPQGDADDPTRHPDFYDPTYGYLREIGIRTIDA